MNSCIATIKRKKALILYNTYCRPAEYCHVLKPKTLDRFKKKKRKKEKSSVVEFHPVPSPVMALLQYEQKRTYVCTYIMYKCRQYSFKLRAQNPHRGRMACWDYSVTVMVAAAAVAKAATEAKEAKEAKAADDFGFACLQYSIVDPMMGIRRRGTTFALDSVSDLSACTTVLYSVVGMYILVVNGF